MGSRSSPRGKRRRTGRNDGFTGRTSPTNPWGSGSEKANHTFSSGKARALRTPGEDEREPASKEASVVRSNSFQVGFQRKDERTAHMGDQKTGKSMK